MLYRLFYRKLRSLSLPLLAAVLFSMSGMAHAQQSAPADDGSATLRTLEQTLIPAADRIDLAQRLQGVTMSAPSAQTPLQPKIYKVGDHETFWATNASGVSANAHETQFQVTAELIYVTPHLYMWFQIGTAPDVAGVKRSADKFENSIYPTVHTYFGSERSPGIDGDVHLYILHAHKLGSGVAGYFSSADSYPRAVVKTSNEHNMFFVNLDSGTFPGSPYYEGVLAHEFQHMVHHVVHPNQESWMNEGMSELSRLINGYIVNGGSFAPTFTADPLTQLNTWDDGAKDSPHYGGGYLFMAYIAQRFGNAAIHAILADKRNGLLAVTDVLSTLYLTDPATHKPITLTDLFADWQIANLLQQPNDTRYGYTITHEAFPAVAISATLTPGTHSDTVTQFGTRYLELKTPGTYTLHFAGQPTVKVIPTQAHSGQFMWWAGRSDTSDARLTHDFDLTGVPTATLDFWLWHSIEKEWDYGYVEVSTDGGVSWTPLSSTGTDDNDPYANAYGPGFTGNSGVDNFDVAQPAQWTEQKVNLTAYAGKAIKVRFEYVTDDSLSLYGMAIDDIQIPEIHYNTDAEGNDGGWLAEGWARINNVLPQRFLIQEVDYGTTPHISRLLDSTGGIAGDWTIRVGGSVPRVVISIAGMTQFTTERAPYTYTLTAQR